MTLLPLPHTCMSLPFTVRLHDIMHKTISGEMLFLFLITIFPFTPPFSCPHFWHANNSSLSLSSALWMTGCTAIAVKSPLWQAGAACCTMASDLPGGSHDDTFAHPYSISTHLTTLLFRLFSTYFYLPHSPTYSLWVQFKDKLSSPSSTSLAPLALSVRRWLQREAHWHPVISVEHKDMCGGGGDDKDSTADISLLG